MLIGLIGCDEKKKMHSRVLQYPLECKNIYQLLLARYVVMMLLCCYVVYILLYPIFHMNIIVMLFMLLPLTKVWKVAEC